MRMVDIIIKKREKLELSQEEIEFFINSYTRGEIPDYQASALLMAIVLNGMTALETTNLTMAMARSGEMLDLSNVVPIAVDKHSTGGVGDKTTLVVIPMVSACGLAVGKMSGRGLGFSGGTLDKLESIPGFQSKLTSDQFLHQLKSIGIVLTGQSTDLAPADGKLYALRDVTGTVQSIPLIASSIMSKKIAAGAQAILLDVKVGSGAFMENLEDAQQLARLMVEIGKLAGRKTVAILSDMNQPLGNAVGNVLELKEAIATLKGNGPDDFRQHCLVVSGYMLYLGGLAVDEIAGQSMAREALESGQVLNRFKEFIQVQGGDVRYIDNPDLLEQAQYIKSTGAPRNGYLAEIGAREVGETAVMLGGGRAQKGDLIDHSVGVVIHHKVGELVRRGVDLFTIHANNEDKLREAEQATLKAIKWSKTPVKSLPLYYGIAS